MKSLYVIFILLSCMTLTACEKSIDGPNPTGEPFVASSEIGGQEYETIENSNAVIVNTAWIARDESYMVFMEENRYAWYQKKEITDDNYYAGTYEFFMGSAALEHLTVDLADYGVTKEEMQQVFDRNEEYSLDNFVCMTVDNDSFMLNGQEQLEENKEVSYFGFLLEDGTYLDIANMTTGTYYGFTKE